MKIEAVDPDHAQDKQGSPPYSPLITYQFLIKFPAPFELLTNYVQRARLPIKLYSQIRKQDMWWDECSITFIEERDDEHSILPLLSSWLEDDGSFILIQYEQYEENEQRRMRVDVKDAQLYTELTYSQDEVAPFILTFRGYPYQWEHNSRPKRKIET